jgi:uncharacterized protein (TIGR03067 family)
MKLRTALLAVAAVFLVAADAKKEARPGGDKLEGAWKLESAEFDGAEAGNVADLFSSARLVIKGGKMAVQSADKKDRITASYTAEPKAKPAVIDFKNVDGDGVSAEAVEGIYEVDGDTLKLCVYYNGDDKQRPSEFKTSEGSHRYLLIFKRDK